MKSNTVVSQSGHFIINEFVYDYMGRLASKTVTEHTGFDVYGYPVGSVTALVEKYIYNGWNVVAVLHDDGTTEDVITYTWGLDLSGSLQRAGGVGGLVAIQDGRTGGTYSIAQDGNGNIAAVIDLSSKAIVAEFEYSPYGEIIRQSGSYADKMPYRFSTKWYDENTNLYYYGYRFYDPKNGRFINRDPIGESGGINLYAFVGNDPVNKWDYLGMMMGMYKSRFIDGGGAGGWDYYQIETQDDDPIYDLPPVYAVECKGISINGECYESVTFSPAQQGRVGGLVLAEGGGSSESGVSAGGVAGGNDGAQGEKWSEEDCNNLLADIKRKNSVADETLRDLNDQIGNEIFGETVSTAHLVTSTAAEISGSISGLLRSGAKILFGRIKPWVSLNGKVMSDYASVTNRGNAQSVVYGLTDGWTGEVAGEIAKAGTVQAGSRLSDSFQDALGSGASTLDYARHITDSLQGSFNKVHHELGNMIKEYKENCK